MCLSATDAGTLGHPALPFPATAKPQTITHSHAPPLPNLGREVICSNPFPSEREVNHSHHRVIWTLASFM